MGDSTKDVTAANDLKEATSIHVYPAKLSSEDDLSVLVCTKSGNVYGKGLNSLVMFHYHPFPMIDDGSKKLEKFVKIEKLCGLGLKKIAVGVGYGVGLTGDGAIYMWGSGPKVVDEGDVLLYEEYVAGGACAYCGESGCGQLRKGGADLYRCRRFSHFNTYTPKSPPADGVKVKVFVKYNPTILSCSRCGKCCIELLVGGYGLNYCKPCDLLQEAETVVQGFLPCKILSGILDVDCGRNFICTLSENREFQVMKWAFPHMSEYVINLPENQTISSFSCGRTHIAVVTKSGALYCYGDGDNEKMIDCQSATFTPFTMRNVAVPSAVKKVFSGNMTTVCLLVDHSVLICLKVVQRVFRSYCPGPTGEIKSSLIFFSDIVGSVNAVNRFFFKGTSSCVFDALVGDNGVASLCNSDEDVSELFLNLQTSQTSESASHDEQQDQPDEKLEMQDQVYEQPSEDSLQSIPQDQRAKDHSQKLSAAQTRLFAQKIFSDVTIKLADEEFPAHRMLLYSTSNYFRKLFSNDVTPQGVLDMSSYNPKAYKALLQHFYGAEVDVLDFEDLMDLYSLAVSYEESDILKIVTHQLKAHIRFETVLQLLSKAKSSGNEELVDECKTFMSSSAYKDWVVASIFQDPSALILQTIH